MDLGSNVNVARVRARQSTGVSSGRCVRQADARDQCPTSVPDSEFFCSVHTAEILASTDPYVRETWERFQTEAASYRKTFPDDPTP